MAKDKNEEMRLPSLDELFSSQEERDDAKLKRIYEIPISEIDPFPDHPFHVRDDDDMMNLVESVKVNGVITPATVRKKEDGRYELLSGHRRMRACELAGMESLRCEVVDMDRDEATVFMVESNFQRTTILPSEKAFAYKMRLEAMNRQGQRTDLTCSPLDNKLKGVKSASVIKEETGDSQAQVYRFIRLTELIPELLDMVDEKKIALRPAVEISYLPRETQQWLCEAIEYVDATPSHAQTIKMRKFHEEGKLTQEVVESIMEEEKPNQKIKPAFKDERIIKLIPRSVPMERQTDYVIKALEFYARHLERKRSMER